MPRWSLTRVRLAPSMAEVGWCSPVGHVIEADQVPEVLANQGYTFKCWNKIPEGLHGRR